MFVHIMVPSFVELLVKCFLMNCKPTPVLPAINKQLRLNKQDLNFEWRARQAGHSLSTFDYLEHVTALWYLVNQFPHTKITRVFVISSTIFLFVVILIIKN